MYLPLRKSAAEEVLREYSDRIEQFVGDPQSSKSQLLDELKALQSRCEVIGKQMLDDLGIEGSSLEDKEQNLNKSLRSYQQETFFMNGKGLEEFILRSISQAGVFNVKLQQRYQDFLYKTLNVTSQEELDKISPERFGQVMYDILGESLDGVTFYITTDTKKIEAYKSKDNKLRGRGIVLSKVFDYNSLNKTMQNRLNQVLGDAKFSSDNTDFSIQITEENLYNILNLKSEEFSNLEKMMQKDSSLLQEVKNILKDKLNKSYNGSHPKAWKYALEAVIDKATPAALFAGKNAPKNITGLLGELQAIYYIKCLVPRSQPKWIGTPEGKGIKPHADVIFKQYGIQVKNTTYQDASKFITFENFESAPIHSLKDIKWNKIIDENYTKIATTDTDLFEAATQLLGLEFFNVPYVWDYDNKRAEEVDIDQVPQFKELRLQIMAATEKARQALAYFLAGMMHMQFQPTKDPKDANTLYIIGGNLAITGASILLDVIHQIEHGYRSFDFSIKTIKAKTGQKENKFNNIVDVLNSTGYRDTTKLILQSSYNFFTVIKNS